MFIVKASAFVNININTYNYYALATQNWCKLPTTQIHGLWANIDTTHYPSNCIGKDFSLDLLQTNQTLLNLMNKNWNNDCNNQTSEQLWEHEYNKHSKCITLQTGIQQNEFFEKVIDLYLNTQHGCYDLNFTEIKCPITG